MANYDEDLLFGGVTLLVTSVTPSKNPGSVLQKIGKSVVSLPVIGRQEQQYVLGVSGIIYENSLSALGTTRGQLEALDDAEPHELVDGIHDGDYVIETGSLKFSDDAERTANTHYVYSMTLIQKV